MGPGKPALPAGPGGPAEPGSPGGPMGPEGPRQIKVKRVSETVHSRMILLLILFIKRDHVESHACHHVLTPGGRCAGGPIGVGCAVSTSLSVEPSGKLLTAGRNVRPSSNSLIWNESSRSQTLCMSDVISGHILRHKKRPLRMHQRTFLYL